MKLQNVVGTMVCSACLAAAITTSAQAAGPTRGGLFTRHPRVIRYDPVKDEFVHQRSLITSLPRERPGGAEAYYGNRLEKFRYVGRPGTGGIYDALDEHQRNSQLDPANYQYRWRW